MGEKLPSGDSKVGDGGKMGESTRPATGLGDLQARHLLVSAILMHDVAARCPVCMSHGAVPHWQQLQDGSQRDIHDGPASWHEQQTGSPDGFVIDRPLLMLQHADP